MNDTVTDLQSPLEIPLNATSQNVVTINYLVNEEWSPINFQWRSLFELKEELRHRQNNDMDYSRLNILDQNSNSY